MKRRYLRWMSVAVTAALTALTVIPAKAQFFCDEHEKLVARLDEAFRERRIGYGLAGSTMIVEVFVSARGTWTMLMTDLQGRSCIVAAGDGWELEVADLDQGT